MSAHSRGPSTRGEARARARVRAPFASRVVAGAPDDVDGRGRVVHIRVVVLRLRGASVALWQPSSAAGATGESKTPRNGDWAAYVDRRTGTAGERA